MKCENCEYEYEQYHSFGHFDDEFDYKWKCGKCNFINIRRIKSMGEWGEKIIKDWEERLKTTRSNNIGYI